MLMLKRLTRRVYAIINIVFAALFANILLFGGRLEMGKAFTAGLATGIGIGWAIFAFAGWSELRKPGHVYDERATLVMTKASGTAFWITLLAAALLTAAFHSEALDLSMSPSEMGSLMMNLGLASFSIAWFTLSRRM